MLYQLHYRFKVSSSDAYESNPADRHWPQQLAVHRFLARRETAAAVMALIQSAKLNGHDPYAYLNDVLTRLHTQPASRIDELLPHNWQPTIAH